MLGCGQNFLRPVGAGALYLSGSQGGARSSPATAGPGLASFRPLACGSARARLTPSSDFRDILSEGGAKVGSEEVWRSGETFVALVPREMERSFGCVTLRSG